MRRMRWWALRFVAVLAAAAVACAAAPAAGPPAAIAVGVTVDGLPVGGFTSEPTRTLLRETFARPLEFRVGERTWRARPDRLGATADVDAAVAAAFGSATGDAVDLDVAVSGTVLKSYVHWLDRTLSRPARNTELLGLTAKLRPRLSQARAGRRLDRLATIAAIERALDSAARETVRPVFHRVPAKVTRASFGPVVVIRRESKGLFLYNGKRLVRRMPVATGTAVYPTPIGSFTIVTKQMHPWWYPPNSDWARGLKPVPPGPGNPLGTRWMGLSVSGVGIHGTPDAASVGYSASHGCIRMYVPDAEWLFERVRHGTAVVIVSA
jgi:L,D-transpeptidase catalytic domain